MFLPDVCVTAAHAQYVLFVSNSGSDTRGCGSPADACGSLFGAQNKALDGATITCVNPGYYGFVTITKSITVDCIAGGGGYNIGTPTINAPGKVVTLRNVSIAGQGSGLLIDIAAAASVHLENVVLHGGSIGLRDLRTGPGKLFISDSSIGINSGPSIVIAPQGGTRISAVLDNVRVTDSGYGLAVGAGGRVMIKRSVVSGNSTGIEADADAIIAVNDTLISGNTTGMLASGGSAVVISNSDIVSNNTGISGATRTFGNNRIFANAVSDGTFPSPMGSVSSENGQR
jgi:hypothetical protein